MQTIDEMPDVLKTWMMYNKLREMEKLLWEMYYVEFQKLKVRDEMLALAPQSLPFWHTNIKTLWLEKAP